MGLKEYHKKRDFKKTGEPEGKVGNKKGSKSGRGVFVIQKHEASRLHFDFRLEMEGVLRSWAVPKGPSLNPKDKRLAVQVEDHPLEYGDFEGIIPEGEYGGGTVMLWDVGEWESLEGDAVAEWKSGSMKFRLMGERLTGTWALVKMQGGKYGDDGKNWLLIKERDDVASHTGKGVTDKFVTSVTTDRQMKEIAAGDDVWESNRKSKNKSPAAAVSRRGTKPKKDKTKGSKQADASSLDVDLAEVNGTRKTKFPHDLRPQLASLVKSAPVGGDWVHEIKFDGYRFLAHIEGGEVTLVTRNGKDWTKKFPDVVEGLKGLPVETAVVDGELVALDAKGVSRFQLLQNAIKGDVDAALVYYAFDLVYLNGYSLKGCSLDDRKSLLREITGGGDAEGVLRFSEHFRQDGDEVWDQACRMGLEGIISKDLTAPYVEKRSKSWVKVKCSQRQEFVIGGFSKPSGSRKGLGALLVGFYDDAGELQYAGKVGTGFTDASLKELHGELMKLKVDKCAFANCPKGAWVRGVTWVKPKLVAEVAYTEMTGEGLLRHPSFQGLREDKPATGVTRERAGESKSKSSDAKAQRKQSAAKKSRSKMEKGQTSGDGEESVKLSNPDRVLFPESEFTKQDLADYYETVLDRAFPWMRNRPLTLVRCPEGRGKPCFYQRHTKDTVMPGIEQVDVKIKGRKETYFYLADAIGLRALVQNSTLELHGWQCNVEDVERPDRVIFDVDPSEEVKWPGVVKAARTLKDLLEKCGFETFVMTTGGKGLHVVVPLVPRAGWDEVIGFAEQIARFLEVSDPDNYTANLSKKKRVGKVFVDYLRNNKTASAVLPYSSRARVGATVATPLRWGELSDKLDPAKFTIKTVPGRVARQKSDPWAGYEKARRKLDVEAVVRALGGFEP